MSDEARKRRMFLGGALLVTIGALSVLAFGGIGKNLVFYWSPTECVEAGDKAIDATIRLGGLVKEGTLQPDEDGSGLDFVVTDEKNEIRVPTEAVPPAMFREGVGVVLEGTMTKDGVFDSRRLMIKHDNEYRAPEDGKEFKQMLESMQFEEDS